MGSHATLARSDPVLAGLIERLGRLSFETRRRGRPRADSYGTLLRSVVGQQLSAKAAATIYDRVLALFDGATPSPEQLLAVDAAALRATGLSGRKVEYVRDLAAHVALRRARARPPLCSGAGGAVAGVSAVEPDGEDVPLRFEGVTKAYKDGFVAVRDLSFEVRRGQVLGPARARTAPARRRRCGCSWA